MNRDELRKELEDLGDRCRLDVPGAASVLYALAASVAIRYEDALCAHIRPFVKRANAHCRRVVQEAKARLN